MNHNSRSILKGVILSLLFAALFIQTNIFAQDSRATYSKLVNELYKYRDLSANDLILKAALLRQETPYVANTLEKGDNEELIINLNETDCILFVESCFALAQSVKSGDTSFVNFCDNIKNFRYRNGIIDGYTSRIHYTSEWILQAEERGLVKEMSKEIADTPLDQKFSFMTSKSDRYKQLKNNPSNIARIAEVERDLNNHSYYYIPKSKVPQYLNQLQPGDMIGFCTSIEGLDLTHVGIVIEHNGKKTFIHASMDAMKVVIDHRTIVEYINGIKSNIGIRIIRGVFQ
ncbi:MAG: DUF1460 domain-containing protein [Bacteroidales bacterium]|nr:DUF1460 domain-containing protein [Bacteroidales bacterium]